MQKSVRTRQNKQMNVLIDSSRTDKNTVHSYIDLYESLMHAKKNSATMILEVGIHRGGSIKLWHDYFTNATVYGIDIQKEVWSELQNKDRIKLLLNQNAYDQTFFQDQISDKRFDIVLDDGPHTLQSMLTFVKMYSSVLKEDGILIIEDVQSWDWISKLTDAVPETLKKHVHVYDLRKQKNRYDDIVFCINLSN